ncbi:hypothetical protein GQ43DRAFT_381003 [Delitschia confertaspora ATCC 74209]|uniref:Rhodopsin domain-containing protein n=1 Tax=Delitschia confertaspora ATCC 74209 TaxID=1513339 RepID=A0A9P4JDH8_9PLEO|nr:hypothetical protein GQ43DRAFT_381003 [Delitschia confertaspora ATCC 74209]
MSSNSALMGHVPISHTDILIRRGLLIVSPSQLNPNKSQPFGPPRPADYQFETHGPSLRIGEGLAIFFIILFTSARIWTRIYRTKYFGLDDWMIIPGALSAIVYLSLDIVSNTKGCLGKHIYDCTYSEIYWYMRPAQVQQPLFYFCVFSVKLSIALANKRITGLASERWIIVHWVFISLFLVLLPITVFLQAFQCLPIPARYSLIYIGSMADPHQLKCLNTTAISLSTRILHILTDVALLCVPIIIVLRLRIPKRKKARLTCIFAFGGMSTVASILRNRIITRYLDDVTWQYYEIYVWNTIDICFAVIVASLPALNTLLDAGIDKMKLYTSSRGSDLPNNSDSNNSRGDSKKSAMRLPSQDGDSGVSGFHLNHFEPENPGKSGTSSVSFVERDETAGSTKCKRGQTFEEFLLYDHSLAPIPTDNSKVNSLKRG